MKRRIYLCIISILCFALLAYAESAQLSTQKVYINGSLKKVSPYNIAGYNYFRLRDIRSALNEEGVDFELSGDSEKIVINTDRGGDGFDEAVKLPPFKEAVQKLIIIVLNGKTYGELKAYNIDGFNYFKLRDLSDILNIKADYDAGANSVKIATVGGADVSDLLTPEKDKVDAEKPGDNGVKNPDYGTRTVLGNERLTREFSYLIDGRNIGLVTNQTGVNSNLVPTGEVLKNYKNTNLVAVYSPEHGYDGKAPAGEYVESYFDKNLGLNVYSIYGATRKPTKEMLKGVDVLVFDMQDIGSRTYTYMSSLNYCMRAAKENGIKIVVLDRPNPLGGNIAEGFVLEEKFESFVGVDELPMAHGMTAGELAQFFNRKIGADLYVVPMLNWSRSMVWQDTGLPFVATSPNIPNIESAFNYMATGSGDGTGLGQSDKFLFIGMKGLDPDVYTNKMNEYMLEGVKFEPAKRGERGGVTLTITDYRRYNPCKTGIYLMAEANLEAGIKIPKVSGKNIPMFVKIMGTERMGELLERKATPQEITAAYADELGAFMRQREQYLLYK